MFGKTSTPKPVATTSSNFSGLADYAEDSESEDNEQESSSHGHLSKIGSSNFPPLVAGLEPKLHKHRLLSLSLPNLTLSLFFLHQRHGNVLITTSIFVFLSSGSSLIPRLLDMPRRSAACPLFHPL